MKAFIRLDDGQEIEITDVLKVLYDGVVDSLNWGSGWWDGEDAAAVGWIGLTFGWARASDAAKHAEDIQAFERFRQALDITVPPVPERGVGGEWLQGWLQRVAQPVLRGREGGR